MDKKSNSCQQLKPRTFSFLTRKHFI